MESFVNGLVSLSFYWWSCLATGGGPEGFMSPLLGNLAKAMYIDSMKYDLEMLFFSGNILFMDKAKLKL